MQTYSPFNWNNTYTPFAQNFGGFYPWNWTPGFTGPQNWNVFPGFQQNWNTTPWFGYTPANVGFQNWSRPFATTPWNTQPWNTFNGAENFQGYSNWTPSWNTPFNASWFQPTTNWFNQVPFGFYPSNTFNQPFNTPVNPGSYPFNSYAGGNYPFAQNVPTNTPVYPTVGHPCRDAA